MSMNIASLPLTSDRTTVLSTASSAGNASQSAARVITPASASRKTIDPCPKKSPTVKPPNSREKERQKVANPYAKKRRTSINPYAKKRSAPEEEVALTEETWRPFFAEVPPEADARGVHFVAFDLETHGWLDKREAPPPPIEGRTGAFGHTAWTNEANLEFSRIAQVGWRAYGRDGGLLRGGSRIVSDVPGGIMECAARYHKITDEEAAARGIPLRAALGEVLADLTELAGNGGTLVGHHLEFDAGIFVREMRRAGCPERLVDMFRELARGGTCTMHDAVLDRGGRACWQRPALKMCHDEFVRLGGLEVPATARGKWHDAEHDAKMTWEVFVALRRRDQVRSKSLLAES